MHTKNSPEFKPNHAPSKKNSHYDDSNATAPLKPFWIRAKSPTTAEILHLKKTFRENHLHTVCEEANCPNLGECFRKGTATFIIMGKFCTRECPFCEVTHGKPAPLDIHEPRNLAYVVNKIDLNYVVITSVNRDDLGDGGATHFVNCINEIKRLNAAIKIEILVPDFRNKVNIALEIFEKSPPDVFNHNLETIPRLYKQVRPGASYSGSLSLLKLFKEKNKMVPTKSGLMLGIGEEMSEVHDVMNDLRNHHCEILTIGQYLQPSPKHFPVAKYVLPQEFDHLKNIGLSMGFSQVISGPMVRSSYHPEDYSIL